jgi:16S rRNA (guanine1207-N2)-methyltransferase
VDEHYFSEKPTSEERRGLIRCTLEGIEFEFETSSGVFSGRRLDPGTRLLIENLETPSSGRILDLGCGYGPVGIFIAKRNPTLEVWMTDINSRAIDLARLNAIRNGVNNISIVQGNLYEAVEGKIFNLIVSNPPISAGIKKVVEPLIDCAPSHLTVDGVFEVVVQSNKGGRTITNLIKNAFCNVEVVGKRSGYRVLKAQVTL